MKKMRTACYRWSGKLLKLPEQERQEVLLHGCEHNFFCHLGPPGRGPVGQELLFKAMTNACIDLRINTTVRTTAQMNGVDDRVNDVLNRLDVETGDADGAEHVNYDGAASFNVYLSDIDASQWAPLLED